MRISDFTDDDAGAWDDLVARSWNGTFLVTRRYLSYHGARFKDVSVLLRDDRDRVRAVLPAAVDPGVSDRVTSHPGLTYGGFIHDGSLVGQASTVALEGLRAHYGAAGFSRLLYKPVPDIFHVRRTEDDLHALQVLGASRVRSDLAAAVDLRDEQQPDRDRRYRLRRAQAARLTLAPAASIADLWPLIEETLSSRHGATPTHTAAEMTLLAQRFPENILSTSAHLDGRLVAAAIVYRTRTCDHTQYLAASPEGRQASALDLMVHQLMGDAQSSSRRYLGFGISTENGGRQLNDGLHAFKMGFGSMSLTFDAYEWVF